MIYPHQLCKGTLSSSPRPPPPGQAAQFYLPPSLLYFTEAGELYRAARRTLGLGPRHFTRTGDQHKTAAGAGIVKYCWSES